MDDIFKNALEFCVFSYFKISFDKDVSNLIDILVKKAYEDATMQNAFNALIEKGNGNLRNKANEAGGKAIELVINWLKLFSSKHDISYRDWHNQLCNEIGGFFNDVKKNKVSLWSYGNSQKLVNMSVKYVVLLSSVFKELDKRNEAQEELCKIGQFFTKNISNLDIPVDSFIIEALWEKDKHDPKATIPIKKRIKNNTVLGAYSDDKYKPWSKWSQTEYETFEKSLKDYVEKQTEFKNAFDWESHAWIDIAKGRRKDDSDKDQE